MCNEGSYGEKRKNCEKISKSTLIYFSIGMRRQISFDRTNSVRTTV